MVEWRTFTRGILSAVPNSPRFIFRQREFLRHAVRPPCFLQRTSRLEKFAEFLRKEPDTFAIISQHAYTGGCVGAADACGRGDGESVAKWRTT
jgi:hypothetical protein